MRTTTTTSSIFVAVGCWTLNGFALSHPRLGVKQGFMGFLTSGASSYISPPPPLSMTVESTHSRNPINVSVRIVQNKPNTAEI